MGGYDPSTGARRLRALVAKYLNADGVLLALALLVGLGAGLGALVFRWLIGVVRSISFEWLPAGHVRMGSRPTS